MVKKGITEKHLEESKTKMAQNEEDLAKCPHCGYFYSRKSNGSKCPKCDK